MEEIKEVIQLLFGENDELRNIILVTLKMSFFTVVISTFVGISLGYLVGEKNFKYKIWIVRIVNTLMSLPPVIGGLIVYLILSRSGPLGKYRLLFTVQAMVFAQVLLITPIVMGLTIPIFGEYKSEIRETALGIGLNKNKQFFLMLYECRKQLIAVIVLAFGRSIAEVGAVSLVGGNIQYKTRVMTTAIVLETNRGNFHFAIALGIVLISISFVMNSIVACLQEEKYKDTYVDGG